MAEKQKIPEGLVNIKALLILFIIGGVLLLLLNKSLLIGAGLFSGFIGDIFIVISLVVMILIVVGINKRSYTLYKLALIWFSLMILEDVIYVIIQLFNLEYFNQLLGVAPHLSFMCLFMWYLLKRKDYFVDKYQPFNFDDPIVQKQEKTFKRAVIGIFIILFIIIFLPKTTDLYKTITIMKGVYDKDVPTALELCRSKNIADRDFCIYEIVKSKNKEYDFGEGEVCEEISSSKYKDNCYMLLYQCNKLTNKNAKNICETLRDLSKKISKSPPSNGSVSYKSSNLTQRPS